MDEHLHSYIEEERRRMLLQRRAVVSYILGLIGAALVGFAIGGFIYNLCH